MAFVRIYLTRAAPGCEDLPGSDFARWPVIPEPTPSQVIQYLAQLLQMPPNQFTLSSGIGFDPNETLVHGRDWTVGNSFLLMAKVIDGMSFADLRTAQADITATLKNKAA
ncbi:hypothetical protein ABAC460_10065 [Asticcacaulis sp. AC460]|uniref:hypothetical protein n=1 Tax=Asticcacaulis sp. AC460 TaxID=1282360 RepID=UPI0003C3D484|nr:hypothetical protein [Asticcacaulis sp. AC460]ESQ90102.1 hypothetical protein ABAC460_10065 [Asticcacaulis sp. AC460]